ncbi:J domain-containing protein [Prochlorothrix hollandica]|uniref:hypothetical protein n=1 Tax=Prochlorothrix hollandica TaxID=1223 RepID=UPI00034CFA00|nr:hypothetical protein [Prochlorothrix hollandica]
MKENLFSINPYAVLGLSRSVSTAEITKAMGEAMKRKQFPIDVIAKAQKSLMNPQKRILADYLYPILPVVQRFKKQDYSELDVPSPTLEFLPQFDKLEEEIENSRSITPSDEALGKMLFSSLSTTELSVFQSNTLEDDLYQFDPKEKPFNNLNLPVLASLESVPLGFKMRTMKPQGQRTRNRLLRILIVTLSLIITLLVSLVIFFAAKLGFVNSKSFTNSVPISPQLAIEPTPERSQPLPSRYSNSILNTPSVTPIQDSNLLPMPTLSPQSEDVVKKRSNHKFPADTCGDRDPGGANTWYPVYVNYSEKNLSIVKNRYCRDAISHYRDNIGLHSIQIASFLNRSDAQAFAELMQHEIGSGEVGEPNQRNVDAQVSIQSRQRSAYNFPTNTCGDRNPGGANTWYPVYINYSERNLSLVKNRYCRDAMRKYRENFGLYSIQVASFLTQADAQKFSEIMRNEVGSGEVGEGLYLLE